MAFPPDQLMQAYPMVTNGESPEIDRIGVVQEVLRKSPSLAERERILRYAWQFWHDPVNMSTAERIERDAIVRQAG